MTLQDEYIRVDREHPCELCDHADWCMYRRGPNGEVDAIICPRTTSDTKWGDAGYFHDLSTGDGRRQEMRPRKRRFEPQWDYGRIAERLEAESRGSDVERLAERLHVPLASLRALGVGYVSRDRSEALGMTYPSEAWSFPMMNASGRIAGIRLRLPSGKKIAVDHSKAGLFIPKGLKPGSLLIAEGESDTAAVHALGLPVVGRPGASSCRTLIVRWLRKRRVSRAVVLGDMDGPGAEGARLLRAELTLHGIAAPVVQPPDGDMRSWIAAGASRDDILELVRRSSALEGIDVVS